MSRYLCGPSVLRLTGRVGAVIPGDVFEHDFSPEGPEGRDGPAREAANLAAGAFALVPGEITEAAKLEARAAAAAAAMASAPAAEETTAPEPDGGGGEPTAAKAEPDAATTGGTKRAPRRRASIDNKGE